MHTRWPVLVAIAVVGSISGLVIAGRDEPVGTLTAAPALTELEPATISSTSTLTSAIDTSSGAATVESTTTIKLSSPVVPSVDVPGPETTTTTIVLSLPVVPSTAPSSTTPVVGPPAPTSTTTTIVLSSPVAAAPSTSAVESGGPPTADRSSLRLVVAGADGRTGLADATAARLADLGYGDVHIARATAPVEFTTIYYRAGFNRAAVAVAIDLEATDPTLQAFPADGASPLTDGDDKGDVIALLGSDVRG